MTAERNIQNNSFMAGWLDGPIYDSTLILGVFVIAVASGIIVSIEPSLFMPVMLADLWLLGYHHVISTFTKLAGTKEDRKENWFLIYPLPLFVLLAVSGIGITIGVVAIVTIYLFWQWFHYTHQAWGIAAFYKRKAGIKPSSNPKLDEAVFWSIPVWGILNRCSQGWDQFLFLPVWMPSVPIIVTNIAGVLACASIIYWLIRDTKIIEKVILA